MEFVILSIIGMIFAFIAGYTIGKRWPEQVTKQAIDRLKEAIKVERKYKVIPYKSLLTAEEETFKKVEEKFKNEHAH